MYAIYYRNVSSFKTRSKPWGWHDTNQEAWHLAETAEATVLNEIMAAMRQLRDRLREQPRTPAVISAGAAVDAVIENLLQMKIEERNSLIDVTEEGSAAIGQKIAKAFEAATAQAEELRKLTSGQDRDLVESFFQGMEKRRPIHKKIEELDAENSRLAAAQLSTGEGQRVADVLKQQLAELNDIYTADMEKAKADAQDTFESARLMLAAAVGAALLFAAASVPGWRSASAGGLNAPLALPMKLRAAISVKASLSAAMTRSRTWLPS